MDPARIAELLQPFLSCGAASLYSESSARTNKVGSAFCQSESLSATQLQHISMYIDMLQRWNARINLTAIRDEEQIVTRHFGESFFAAAHLFPRGSFILTDAEAFGCPEAAGAELTTTPNRVADLGSGAGFPGIPIKLWSPGIALTLIEANHKKATFLREVVRALTLTDVDIQNVRGETLFPSTYDLVTFRAVERFPQTLRTAAGLLAPKGRLALLIASSQIQAAESTLAELLWRAPIPVPQSNSRVLVVGVREADK